MGYTDNKNDNRSVQRGEQMTERQLRQTIDDQDKEICLLKDQLNRLTEINNNLWNLFIEQSKQIKRLNNLKPISNELERNERNKK